MTPTPLDSLTDADLCASFDLDAARIGDRPRVERRLADLRGSFHDAAAYEAALASGNPIVYAVTAVEPASGDGQLHYGLGILHPGKIGGEYFLTKGHFHSHRAAAEIYIGLQGEGAMLLEDEASGKSKIAALKKNTAIYIPGHTAHRTINTGSKPLVYLGIYPSSAGHDYAAIASKNFRMILVEEEGKPCLKPRRKKP